MLLMPVKFIFIIALIVLSGCASVTGTATAPSQYLLNPALPAATANNGDIVLQIAMPQAAAGYETAAMLYMREAHVLEKYTQSEWVDTPARMLLPLIVQQLESTGQFAAVLSANSPQVAGQWLLNTEIMQFQQEFFTTPSQMHLKLRVQLIDRLERQILTTATLHTEVTASTDDAGGGALAAQQVVADTLQKLAQLVQAQLPKSLTNTTETR